MDESIFDLNAVRHMLNSDPDLVISSMVDDQTRVLITRWGSEHDRNYRVMLEMARQDLDGDEEYDILAECMVNDNDGMLDLLVSYVEHGGDPKTLKESVV